MPKRFHLSDVDPAAIALCKKGANGQRIFLKKSVAEDELIPLAREMKFHKAAADDWSTLYCIVASPGVVENGGLLNPDVEDVWASPDEIRKAAHRLAKNKGFVNLEHGDGVDAHIVESAIALTDIKLEDTTIAEGSWYIGIEPSADLRKAVDDGEITGVSLEGTGVRTEQIAKSDDEKRNIWKKLGEALGVSLPPESATFNANAEQEPEVSDTKITELETKIDDAIAKSAAATTAIEGLTGIVNGLVERLDKKNDKKDDEAPDAKSLKKAVDTLTETVNGKLDELEGMIDQLAEGESTQTDKPDIKKSEPDHWAVGIF